MCSNAVPHFEGTSTTAARRCSLLTTCASANKLSSATTKYIKVWLFSPEQLLPFLCVFIHGWVACFPGGGIASWLDLPYKDHFWPDLSGQCVCVPVSQWTLPFLSWWHRWTSDLEGKYAWYVSNLLYYVSSSSSQSFTIVDSFYTNWCLATDDTYINTLIFPRHIFGGRHWLLLLYCTGSSVRGKWGTADIWTHIPRWPSDAHEDWDDIAWSIQPGIQIKSSAEWDGLGGANGTESWEKKRACQWERVSQDKLGAQGSRHSRILGFSRKRWHIVI